MITTLGNKVIFFGLFAGFIAIRGIFAWIAQRSGLSPAFEIDDPVRQKEHKSSPVGVLVILCVLAALVFYAVWPENRNILILPMPDWLSWLGVVLGIISLALQGWVHVTLQKNWLAAKNSGKKNLVIASGPYARIRHPLYLALMLLLAGLALVSGFALFILLTLFSLPFFNTSARQEETRMVQQFGDEYRRYMKNTGRFFPGSVHG